MSEITGEVGGAKVIDEEAPEINKGQIIEEDNNYQPIMEIKNYSFVKGLVKGIVAFILFAAPFFITNYPELANLTIGAVLTILVNFLKVKYWK